MAVNAERATGGIEKGNPPFEAGASQGDTDYMHIINLVRAEEAFADGKTIDVNGFAASLVASCLSVRIWCECFPQRGCLRFARGGCLILVGRAQDGYLLFGGT